VDEIIEGRFLSCFSFCVSCPLNPPKLLTESNWKTLMSSLDKHFGVNATMDDATREAVTQALVADASPDSATSHHWRETGRL
jgi:hypothetical protein